ncbi:hypothetical protein D1646_01280 [Pseudoflavonifractor sp. 60]|uniref:hypothetical protein n=1 Tax=Pseudoflavonifractor sp. 60 TaxID=2304576 RepID=UPI00136AD45B|nr:hypothetical protein [Pseudoflavonifractor sp. 60]MCI8914701.1 hypothetical protein [Lawsonibacter sp.]NBI65459.1 hypothetical protein [Pseudoflavonifractor sp. 60]
MNWISVGAVILLIAGDAMLKKMNPPLWKKIQLPVNVFLSILSLFVVILMTLGVRDVFTSQVNWGDKVVFCLFAAVYIAALVWGSLSNWKKWQAMRQE